MVAVLAGSDAGLRTPAARLARLFDGSSMTLIEDSPQGSVRTAKALVDGTQVFGYCTDATNTGGALGALEADQIIRTIDAVIETVDTRSVIARTIAQASAVRGQHGNIPL